MIDIIILILLITILLVLVTKRSTGGSGILPQVGSQKTNAVVLDSCALIDGRVVELAKIGFMPKHIIVPQFIVKELQLLADGRDSYKRERARFGLQVVQELQKDTVLHVTIDTTDPGKPTTDENLVALAKQRTAELFTTDFNLNQVATIEGVTVLNVNELAHALRPVALPGEVVHVTILQSGTNRDQGVGYLDDGTMVVVDGAIKDIGKSIQVTINKSHQTVAGKMLFAKKVITHQVADNKRSLEQKIIPKSKPISAPKNVQYRKRNRNTVPHNRLSSN
jgi:uncharacterized protein YacL